MNKKYLLYIDILGFAEMVEKDPKKIPVLYTAIDRLNAHRHEAFKTIVFSDTILVFNVKDPVSEVDHRVVVMYACEFVRDLLLWCIKLEIPFRAILLYDEFEYRDLENIESYYGTALIRAYKKEKGLVGMGLFISKELLPYCRQFETTPFDEGYHFVFLTTQLQALIFHSQGLLPLHRSWLDEGAFLDLWCEVRLLRTLKKNIDTLENSGVRAKYLQTYHLYKEKYRSVVEPLEAANFDLAIINNEVDWSKVSQDSHTF